MQFLPNVIFLALLGGAIFWFSKNIGRIRRNILLGRDVDRSDNASGRRANMLRVAFGQSKMQSQTHCWILALYHLRELFNYQYRGTRNYH